MELENLPCIYLDKSIDNALIADAFGRALEINVDQISIIGVEDNEYDTDFNLVIERADYKEGCFVTELCLIEWDNKPDKFGMKDIWELCAELSKQLKCKVLTDGDFTDLINVHEYVFEDGKLSSKVISMEPEDFNGKGLVVMKTL